MIHLKMSYFSIVTLQVGLEYDASWVAWNRLPLTYSIGHRFCFAVSGSVWSKKSFAEDAQCIAH